jgi:hypothetical protein
LVKRESGQFPYEPYPSRLERKPLSLAAGVPDSIRKIVKDWVDSGSFRPGDLTMEARKALERFFGHRVKSTFCLVHHQVGGPPLGPWSGTIVLCPNAACRSHRRPMRFLAGILNDPWRGLPFAEPADEETLTNPNLFVTLQYHICSDCWSIMACNSCD